MSAQPIALNEDVQITASPEDLRYWSDERLFHEAETLLFDAFAKIRAALPYIEELYDRFKRRKRNHAHILGCKNWREFCEKRLHREYQTIYKALKRAREQNEPGRKRKKPEQKPGLEAQFRAAIGAAMAVVEKLPPDRPLEPFIRTLQEFAGQLQVRERKQAGERHAAARRLLSH